MTIPCVCMIIHKQLPADIQYKTQIITPINTPIGFAPPVSCLPDTTQRAIVAAENQQQLRQYIFSLQKLLMKFCCVSFSVSIDYQSIWILFRTNSCTIGFKEN